MKNVTGAMHAALDNGDLVNFLLAATPGGILAQEAAGQQEMVSSNKLPRRMHAYTVGDFTKMGVAFGEPIDELFVEATLPDGWVKRGTDHSMHSEVLDEKGRARIHIFYKASFYDKQADMSLVARYHINTHEEGVVGKIRTCAMDCGEVLMVAGCRDDEARYDYASYSEHIQAAESWLEANFPDWRDARAYWS